MGALRRVVVSAAVVLIHVGAARASPTDGTYSGTSALGGTIEVVVSGGVVTSWSISSFSPSGSGCPSNLSTSVTTCCTVGETFTCGSPATCNSATICAPNGVSYFLVSGEFAGNSVSGAFDFRFQGPVITIPPPCCSKTDTTWNAAKPGPTCSPAATIACGDVVAGDTSAGGATSDVTEYACGPDGRDGAEYAYSFDPGEVWDVRVELTDGAGDAELDLFVLEEAGGGCDPGSCVGASTGVGIERVDFTTEASGAYYFVVDSELGTGAFELSVDCALFRDGFESGLGRWVLSPP